VQRTYTVEYEMTDELADEIVRAVLSRWKHFFRLLVYAARGPLVFALFLLLVVVLLRPQLSAGEALAMIALLAAAAILIARLNIYRGARLALLLPYFGGASRTMQVTFAEDGIVLETAGWNVKQDWREIAAVEIHPGLWLVRLRSGGQIAVPAAVLSSELETFLRRRALEAGAAVDAAPGA
jgi:hypothetical protein